MRYAVVIEKADGNYSAYVPDLPGCIAAGNTVKETQQRIALAIKLHVEALEQNHLAVPQPATVLGHTNAPLTRIEIIGMRKSLGGLVRVIGIAFFLFGLAAFIFPQLGYRPLTLVGMGLAIWVAGRALKHAALAQEAVERIERGLASAARHESESGQS